MEKSLWSNVMENLVFVLVALAVAVGFVLIALASKGFVIVAVVSTGFAFGAAAFSSKVFAADGLWACGSEEDVSDTGVSEETPARGCELETILCLKIFGVADLFCFPSIRRSAKPPTASSSGTSR